MRTLDDRSLSVFALAVVAAMGWPLIGGPNRTATRVAPAVAPSASLAAAVLSMAEAVAFAEGYYAAGMHDGHSLPYFLNNPGALKASTIADDLATWDDTGLLVFPTHEMGWTALRYQVCLMLTGTSRIYEPADTLTLAGLKYADGDLNWGTNVATRLNVPPHTRLVDLAPASAVIADLSSARCLALAVPSNRGTHGSHAVAVD